MVTTIHGFSSAHILPVYRKYDGRTSYVSISDSDRHPDLSYCRTVHHGLDLDAFTFQVTPGAYLLFFGRIHPDKGAVDAIRVARDANMPLVLAGIIQDRGYFEQEIEPLLGPGARYIGPVGPAERNAVLGGALGLLHLIHFDEPFGLSVVEAMACGTPVIAYRRGSMPEIIDDGIGGFLVNDESEAKLAVLRLQSLDRHAVWINAQRFPLQCMVENYLQVYQEILANRDLPRDKPNRSFLG